MGLFSGFFDSIGDIGQKVIDVGKDVLGSDIGKLATASAGFGVGGTTGANIAGGMGIPLQDTLFLDLAGLNFGAGMAGGGAAGLVGGPGSGPGTGGVFGPLSTGMTFGSGVLGLLESRRMRELAERAMNAQPQVIDPMGYGPRADFLAQLQALMADPSKITSMPGYAAGLKGVERTMASQGYLGSGNMAVAAANYGGGRFNDEIARLATLAGVGQPLSVSRPDVGAAIQGQSAASQLLSRAMATFGYGARQLGL